MNEITYRLAEKKDSEAILELWKSLSVDQMSKDPYYEGEMDFRMDELYYASLIEKKDCHLYVATQNDEIVGFIESWLHEPDMNFFIEPYAYILHFFVKEDMRSTLRILDICEHLYYAAEDWAMDCGMNYLISDVYFHNEKVKRILKRRAYMSEYRTMLVKSLKDERKKKSI